MPAAMRQPSERQVTRGANIQLGSPCSQEVNQQLVRVTGAVNGFTIKGTNDKLPQLRNTVYEDYWPSHAGMSAESKAIPLSQIPKNHTADENPKGARGF